MLLDLSHVEAAELRWARALGEQAHCGSLAKPLSQPGQVAVTVQVVGVETAAQHPR